MNINSIYLSAIISDLPEKKLSVKAVEELNKIKYSEPYVDELINTANQIALGINNKNSHSSKRLHAMFEGLLTKPTTNKYAFPLQSLSFNQVHSFPQLLNECADDDNLWTNFSEDFLKITDLTEKAKAETLLQLLHQYTSNIPEPNQAMPDVSFYDFVKIRAGIVVCLHEWLSHEGRATDGFSIDNSEVPFLLFGADISGVQTFLYDIVSKHASKNLKGRSFYLQLLADSILQSMLNEFKLFQGNVIYDSGGGFFLLVPNVFKDDVIEKFEQEITKKLFDEHKTLLYVSLAWLQVKKQDLSEGNAGEAMRTLRRNKLEKKKSQKFRWMIENEAKKLFNPEIVEEGGEQPRDVITGEEISNGEIDDPRKETVWYLVRGDEDRTDYGRENEAIKMLSLNLMVDVVVPVKKELRKGLNNLVKEATAKQISLGRILKNDLRYLVSTTGQPIPNLSEKNRRLYEYNPCGLGVFHYVLNEDSVASIESQLKNHSARILRIGYPEKFLDASKFGKDHQLGFTFYGGKDYPDDGNGEPKTFSEMAGAIEEEKKKRQGENYKIKEEDFKRLGVLRMDIDDLGYIFQDIGKSKTTFAHYATLSRQLDYFFKGYLNEIWESNDNYKSYTQIIYAGGDDLFIVGRWNYVIDFAKDIRKAFTAWTCKNPMLGLSGGVVLVSQKFPVMKAATMAARAEKSAKHHKYGDLEKDAFSLMGKSLRWKEMEDGAWENEFEIVESFKERLYGLLEEKEGLSKGFLQKLQILQRMRANREQRNENGEANANPVWKWVLAYDFAKTSDFYRRKKQIKAAAFIDQLAANFFETVKEDDKRLKEFNYREMKSSYYLLDLLAIAARWTELELRQSKSKAKLAQQ